MHDNPLWVYSGAARTLAEPTPVSYLDQEWSKEKAIERRAEIALGR